MRSCFSCGIEITEKNCYPCDYKKNINCCKDCRAKYQKKYYQKTKPKRLEYARRWNKKQTKLFNKEVSKEDRLFIKTQLIDRDELYYKVLSTLKK